MGLGESIAVLGAGNGGYAMAGDLASRGLPVAFYEHPSFAEGFAETLSTGGVVLEGALGTRSSRVHLATTDIGEVMETSSLLNLVVPSTAQETFFRAMMAHLRDGHTVVVWAGRFGSLRLLHLLKESGIQRDITVVEANTLPYGVRRSGPNVARVLYTSLRLYLAPVPRSNTGKVIEEIGALYEGAQASDSLLAAAFSNPALVVFGIGALLNVARIQHTKGKFYLFGEGITEGVADVMEAAYREMEEVGRALGFSIPGYTREEFRGPASIEGVNFTSPGGVEDFAKMDGPSTVRGRYMMENIGDGIVPIAQLARRVDVACPVLDAVITLGSIVCQDDFLNKGRNLNRLGMGEANPAEIRRVSTEGFWAR
ncbi:MAG: NAD/NADP octopine/nopaline dehydrogenase family protein [Bacillota bacterium]